MTIEVDNLEAEIIDHMRHVSHTGREQIVWRAQVICNAERCLKAIRGEKVKGGKTF